MAVMTFLVYTACFGFLEGRVTVGNSTAAEVFLSLGWVLGLKANY